MRAGLFSGDALADPTSMRAAVLDSPGMAGADLAGAVSTGAPYTVAATGTTRARVAALDLGIKANTPRMLAERGIETRVAAVVGVDRRAARRFTPTASSSPTARATRPPPRTPSPSPRRCCAARCRSSASASATRSSPAPWASGRTRCATATAGSTSRSSTTPTARWRSRARTTASPSPARPGERVDSPFGRVHLSHSCPNDGTVEGLTCEGVPAFSVQYHPEAAAGPHDAADLFDRFADMMGDR